MFKPAHVSPGGVNTDDPHICTEPKVCPVGYIDIAWQIQISKLVQICKYSGRESRQRILLKLQTHEPTCPTECAWDRVESCYAEIKDGYMQAAKCSWLITEMLLPHRFSFSRLLPRGKVTGISAILLSSTARTAVLSFHSYHR